MPDAPPFDPKAYARMTPRERIEYMARLFPQPPQPDHEEDDGINPRP